MCWRAVKQKSNQNQNTSCSVFSSTEPRWAYSIGRPLSSVWVCVYVNIFKHFLWNHSAIEAKFHEESPWDRGTKVCSSGTGHMAKMATIPIYCKNHKKSLPEPKGLWTWNLVCSIRYLSNTKFVQMMTLGWPWPIQRNRILTSKIWKVWNYLWSLYMTWLSHCTWNHV